MTTLKSKHSMEEQQILDEVNKIKYIPGSV